jgi:GT2 family glycosyltransferase
VTRFRTLYPRDLEIIVVDDGSGDLPAVDAKVVTLPRKDGALNPSVPFNRGVEASSGEFIVLTNPEVVHRAPILEEMKAEIERRGPRTYVAAACWSPRSKWWYCHSTDEPDDARVGRAPRPKGAGFHFCAMLRRELYDAIGGFTEDYRDGQGYEDNDLLWKLHAAGALFVIRDDLVTDHTDCPRTEWPKGGAARNRAIFEARWK